MTQTVANGQVQASPDSAPATTTEYSSSARFMRTVYLPVPVDPARVRMRVERQTLRRLPRTGAILFTIRVYLTPLEQLVREPDVPGRMASAIRSWPEDVAK